MRLLVKNIIYIVALLCFTFKSKAQSVINTSGNSSSTYDFSLGEVVIGGTSSSLGYLQPNARLEQLEEVYKVKDIDVPCSSTGFSIPIEASSTVATGINGFDFCFEYDANVITPTGTATVGSVANGGDPSLTGYFLNITQTGKIYGVVYFLGNAPANATFNGIGDIIKLNFTLKAGAIPGTKGKIKLCGITESNVNGSTKDLLFTSESFVNIISDYNLKGSVSFWGQTNKPLRSGTNYISTTAQTADGLCVTTSTAVNTDATGSFTVNVKDASQLYINRSIPGTFGSTANCTNVMTWINGADQNLAMRIATFEPSVTPSVYQIIAADVNLDGRVTAGDVTALNARSAMSICGFNNNGAKDSRDWVFINANELTTNDQYKISTSFPFDDNKGYSKNKVPFVSECLDVPVTDQTKCLSPFTANYQAILLGDVNGNWTTANSPNLRTEKDEYIEVDVLSATTESDGLTIPINFSYNELVYALDFYFETDTTRFDINDIAKTDETNDFAHTWNKYKNMYLLSSYTMNEIGKQGLAYNLKMSTKQLEGFGKATGEKQGFINGKPVSLRFSDVPSEKAPTENDFFSVFPNPTKDIITIQFPSSTTNVAVQVISAIGSSLARINNFQPNGKIDLKDYTTGIYTIIVQSDQFYETVKIVKD
jgi:hypothetical protein